MGQSFERMMALLSGNSHNAILCFNREKIPFQQLNSCNAGLRNRLATKSFIALSKFIERRERLMIGHESGARSGESCGAFQELVLN